MGFMPFVKNRIPAVDWTAPDTPLFVFPVRPEGGVIRSGTKLTVRDSLVAALVANGQVADLFAPGQHVLEPGNLPCLSRMLGWGNHPPAVFEADIYYVQTREFRDLPWSLDKPGGTEGGNADASGFAARGVYSVKVADAEAFLKHILGTNQIFDTAYLLGMQRGQLARALADVCRDGNVRSEELAGHSEQFAASVEERLRNDWAAMGFELSDVRIEEVSLSARETAKIVYPKESIQVTEEERLLLVSGEIGPERNS